MEENKTNQGNSLTKLQSHWTAAFCTKQKNQKDNTELDTEQEITQDKRNEKSVDHHVAPPTA